MKKSRMWKIWLVLGVMALWFWQANKTLDDSQTLVIRGHLGKIATNVLQVRGQEFEVRGDFVYLDASDKHQTLENLSAALTSVAFAGGGQSGFFMMSGERNRFPVFGAQWEPIGYYNHDNVYYEYDPKNENAIPMGPKEGYVYKQHLDGTKERILQTQRNHDHQVLLAAIEKLDERVVAARSNVELDLPCLGDISWDTERPIQRL